MSNSTTTMVPMSGSFNLLYANWSASQQEVYDTMNICAVSAVSAFVTVLTQFVISQWIWSSTSKNNHNSPVYIVPGIVYFLLWYMLMNGQLGSDQVATGIRIAVPLLAYGGVLFNLLFCWIWSIIFNETNKNKTDGDDSPGSIEATDTSSSNEAAEALELGQNPIQESGPSMKKSKPRVHYINNIKIFLTCLVIVHHVGGMQIPKGVVYDIFIYLNQNFFMSLFFFFSGYFSPRSLNKKGTYMFLFDKLKRLGIPLIIMMYLWGPYVEQGMMYLLFRKGQEGDMGFNPSLVFLSVTWFTQQLIIFNIVFAFACGKDWAPKIKCPSLFSFFGMSLLLGSLAALLSLFFPFDGFSAPNFWIYYPSYIVFFFGGALAQVNNWMDAIKDKSRLIIYAWAIICIAITVAVSLYRGSKNPLLFLVSGGSAVVGIPSSLAVTIFFYDFVNKEYAVTPFFSKAMYTSYLIQWTPILAAIKCWLLIMGAVGSDGQSVILTFAGIIFTSMLSLIFDWTLGYAIVSIPGFSQVL